MPSERNPSANQGHRASTIAEFRTTVKRSEEPPTMTATVKFFKRMDWAQIHHLIGNAVEFRS